MKKIIGILGVTVIVATMFFNANNLNDSSSDSSLASLIALNTANAESGIAYLQDCESTKNADDYCRESNGTVSTNYCTRKNGSNTCSVF
ncbi:hypothetical protein SAMN06265349_10797 [Flavobacterium resistens]|uniref:NVEALA protein n=1 Tax=Flavobacterium resistens TaxID=443612 RepID=A0A521F9P7_9FLAO|nr:hypothetical protein [Flavobacterium resistens]MRX70066.1 hypothetical protein [Flavobacterium resistens]SMO92883.1 hypothetical protein SAMN06265349_10797 [Flavobacterium resistens]